jgi:hypothetical protein
MLFSNKRKYELSIPITEQSGPNPTVQYLVQYLCDNLMKDPRKELFVLDDSVYGLHVLATILSMLTKFLADPESWS